MEKKKKRNKRFSFRFSVHSFYTGNEAGATILEKKQPTGNAEYLAEGLRGSSRGGNSPELHSA